jgi:hypothetical protein
MKIALTLFIIAANYYTFTYAQSLWRDEDNKPAAFGAALLSFFGTALPVYVLFFRQF